MKKHLAIGAALLFALLPANAFAASRVWISEFATLGATASGGSAAQIASLPSLVDQPPLDISVSVQTSAAFSAATKFIQIVCEVQCAIKSGGTATTSSIALPSGLYYFGVLPGSTISVIANP